MATSNLPLPTLIPVGEATPLTVLADDASCCGGESCCI